MGREKKKEQNLSDQFHSFDLCPLLIQTVAHSKPGKPSHCQISPQTFTQTQQPHQHSPTNTTTKTHDHSLRAPDQAENAQSHPGNSGQTGKAANKHTTKNQPVRSNQLHGTRKCTQVSMKTDKQILQQVQTAFKTDALKRKERKEETLK